LDHSSFFSINIDYVEKHKIGTPQHRYEFVREVVKNGSISEGTYKDGKLHGLRVFWDGTENVYAEIYYQGQQVAQIGWNNCWRETGVKDRHFFDNILSVHDFKPEDP